LEKVFMSHLIIPSLLQTNPYMTDEAAAGLAGLGCIGGTIVLVILSLFAVALPIFCFWRICEKAGYSGAMALLALIPGIGMIILILILAFGTWPNQHKG
jgi:hypothetical protein